MSKLGDDEKLESISKGLDDDPEVVEAVVQVEKVWGTVQCENCLYWGRMDGWIQPADKRFIQFVCPMCKSVEMVTNPEARK